MGNKPMDYVMPIIIIGGLGIGAYLLYKWTKSPSMETIAGAIQTAQGVVTETGKQTSNIMDIAAYPSELIGSITNKQPVTQKQAATFVENVSTLTDPLSMVLNPVNTLATVGNVLTGGISIMTGGIQPKKTDISIIGSKKKTSERSVIPISAVPSSAGSKVYYKVKAGKIF